MDQKLIRDIQNRVKQVNAHRADESVLSAHLDALADVYDIDRQTIESIARDVIAKQGNKKNNFDIIKLRNLLWISTLVIIIISVIWLLYNNLQTKPKSTNSNLSKKHQRTTLYVAEALASLNVLKVMSAENLAVTGRFPSSFEEIGVKENELITKYISRIKLDNDGTITATFSELINKQQYIKLKPKIRTGSFRIDCFFGRKANQIV